MKLFLFVIALATSIFLSAQTAFYNFGKMKLHKGANIGFHLDFINDGSLDNGNAGLAGFYSDDEIRTISGTNRAVFYDIEIDAINDLELYTSVGVTNNLMFVNGIVFTPRDKAITSLDFLSHNSYINGNNARHVDGYVSVIDSDNFEFPIGDEGGMQPMTLITENTTTIYTGAHFFIDPNSVPYEYETSKKQPFIDKISTIEFWDLDGINETKITLKWSNRSNIKAITSNIKLLRVVGWSLSDNKWIDLGNTSVKGDINSGEVTSRSFIPDNFSALTIATGVSDDLSIGFNIIFTPNKDEHNETLVFEGIETYESNNLTIYNRWGNVVYEKVNYKNDWRGKSKGRLTIDGGRDLPYGTYFYVLDLHNENITIKRRGWIFVYR